MSDNSASITSNLSSEVLALWDTQGAAQFFLKFCGSKTTAVQFLETMIDHIDSNVAANRKRSNPDNGSSPANNKTLKMSSPSNVYGPSEGGGDDAVSDVYVNDQCDAEVLTMVVITPNDIGISSHLIGKQGSNVADIRKRTSCKVQLERIEQVPPNSMDRNVMVTGKVKDLISAYQLIQKRIDEKVESAMGFQTDVTKLVIPNELVAHVIGKSGVIIKKIQSDSGARTQVHTEEEMMMSSSYYGRTIIISGTTRQRCYAIYLILRQIAVDRSIPPLWKGGWPNPISSPSQFHSRMSSAPSMGGGGGMGMHMGGMNMNLNMGPPMNMQPQHQQHGQNPQMMAQMMPPVMSQQQHHQQQPYAPSQLPTNQPQVGQQHMGGGVGAVGMHPWMTAAPAAMAQQMQLPSQGGAVGGGVAQGGLPGQQQQQHGGAHMMNTGGRGY
eukprot:gene2595-5074_t